jgi:restriction system protein
MLVADATKSEAAGVLDGMTWRQFEKLVGEAFRLQGYQVAETGGGGADGGIDLVLRRGGESFLVQCKQWKAFKVGVEVVRELYGVMAAKGASGGFVVTSGQFTAAARQFASGRNVTLIEGSQLQALIRWVSAAASLVSSPSSEKPSKPAERSGSTAPACPLCSNSMVRRKAKRGPNAGSEFWGCITYPGCHGVRSID